MTQMPVCINPVLGPAPVDPELKSYVDFEARRDFLNAVTPYHLEVEITNRCAGSCIYCYAGSTPDSSGFMPKEKVFELLDQAAELGVRQIAWCGGDPLMHPDWMAIMRYGAEKGIDNMLATSSLISRRQAEQVCSLGSAVFSVGVHISSIVPEVYAQLHSNPRTLELKMQGVKNLLGAGYSPERMWALITLSKPAITTFEETLDWFVDQMGIRIVCTLVYKGKGTLDFHRVDWEPGVSELKQVYDYRAKKLGPSWLRLGSGDGSFFYCRTQFGVTWDGRVDPCVCITELSVGNLYQQSLKEIVEKHRDSLLYNFQINGYCGNECPNRDLCFGCRWSAYHYTGDITASDPKCWMNPEAKEHCFH